MTLMTEKETQNADFTPQNIAFIKSEFMKLPSEKRRRILLIANALDEESEGDDLLHSTVWYFSQEKNEKELEKVFADFANNGFTTDFLEESDTQDSSIPRKVEILYSED
jgi:hypothetical protein